MGNSNQLQKLNNFVIFQTDEGKVNIDVFFKDDTLWLTQKLMAELFDVKVSAISRQQLFPFWKQLLRKVKKINIDG